MSKLRTLNILLKFGNFVGVVPYNAVYLHCSKHNSGRPYFRSFFISLMLILACMHTCFYIIKPSAYGKFEAPELDAAWDMVAGIIAVIVAISAILTTVQHFHTWKKLFKLLKVIISDVNGLQDVHEFSAKTIVLQLCGVHFLLLIKQIISYTIFPVEYVGYFFKEVSQYIATISSLVMINLVLLINNMYISLAAQIKKYPNKAIRVMLLEQNFNIDNLNEIRYKYIRHMERIYRQIGMVVQYINTIYGLQVLLHFIEAVSVLIQMILLVVEEKSLRMMAIAVTESLHTLVNIYVIQYFGKKLL